MSDVCQTLVQKCDAHKALILAIGQCLIAAGQSTAAVLEDMSKAIQVKLYSDDDRDLACLATIGIGGSRLLCTLNRAGHLPSKNVAKG